jgi:hypothetical protein
MTQSVIVPARLNFAASNRFAEELNRLPDQGSYVLDFSPLQWLEPFPMLQVVSAVQKTIADKPNARIRARGMDHSYARHMGFFRELGAEVGPDRGHVSNKEHYLPINVLDLAQLRGEAGERGVAVGKVVQRHADQLARTLVQTNYGPLWGTVQYALREIIRNAAEHSGSTSLLYCGQYWPERSSVEIALIDRGIGIANSLRENPHVRVGTDIEALRLAVLPGISGKSYSGADEDPKNEWGHSGFGLYVVSELCRRGGDFTVVSGTSALRLHDGGHRNLKAMHHGTGVRLLMHTENLRSIAPAVELIVGKGERIAREILQLPCVEASVASKRGWLS